MVLEECPGCELIAGQYRPCACEERLCKMCLITKRTNYPPSNIKQCNKCKIVYTYNNVGIEKVRDVCITSMIVATMIVAALITVYYCLMTSVFAIANWRFSLFDSGWIFYLIVEISWLVLTGLLQIDANSHLIDEYESKT